MTKEEMLKQEAEEWINKWELCNKCDHKVQCIEDNAICPQVVERAYLASAEPREKRIAQLEKRCANYEMTISKMEKGTCDICKETEKDKKIEELEKACEETQELLDKQIEATYKLDKENAELKKDKKELCHSISEGGKACVYLNEQLTKATKIIKKLYAVYYAPCVTESDLKYRDELFAEIKKFLSEVEK